MIVYNNNNHHLHSRVFDKNFRSAPNWLKSYMPTTPQSTMMGQSYSVWIEGLNHFVPKWSNRSSKVGHLWLIKYPAHSDLVVPAAIPYMVYSLFVNPFYHCVTILFSYKYIYSALKGQCVGMEAVQFWWFHWQWNHNETKGLRGFTVHVVDSSLTSHALNLEDHKIIQKDGAVKRNVSVF